MSNVDNLQDSKDNKDNTAMTDEEIINGLFYTMNALTDISDIKSSDFDYTYFYQKDMRTNDDVYDFVISYYALYGEKVKDLLGPEIEEYKFSLADIDKKSLEIFGKKVNIDNIIKYDSTDSPDYGFHPGYIVTVEVQGKRFYYDKDKKEFSLVGYGLGGPSVHQYETKIIDVHKYEDKIEITNKVMFEYWSQNEEGQIAKLYREVTANEKIINNEKIYFDKEIADVSDKKYGSIKIEDYIDKLDTFKWTFVKNKDGNFIFQKVGKIS